MLSYSHAAYVTEADTPSIAAHRAEPPAVVRGNVMSGSFEGLPGPADTHLLIIHIVLSRRQATVPRECGGRSCFEDSAASLVLRDVEVTSELKSHLRSAGSHGKQVPSETITFFALLHEPNDRHGAVRAAAVTHSTRTTTRYVFTIHNIKGD